MKTKFFPDLLEECIALMRDVGYSEKSIETYLSVWNKKTKAFMETQMTEYYSVDVGEAFLSSISEDVMYSYNRLRRSITILNSVLETGAIKRFVPQKQVFEMDGEIGQILQDFLSYKQEQRVSITTIDVYERMLGRFFYFSENKQNRNFFKLKRTTFFRFYSILTNQQITTRKCNQRLMLLLS